MLTLTGAAEATILARRTFHALNASSENLLLWPLRTALSRDREHWRTRRMSGFAESEDTMAVSPTRHGLLGEFDRTTMNRPAPKPTKFLFFQAYVWRWLAAIGFFLHRFPNPSPPPPSFLGYYKTTEDGDKEPTDLELAFYFPASYHTERKTGKKFPVILNFHGGGFIMGRPTDDARWAAAVVHRLGVVVVSAQYRLAPEHPFPTAVDDGVAALLWLGSNAEEHGIDLQRLALTGFSAGANLAFTILLRLQDRSRFRTLSSELVIPKPKAIISWYPGLDYRMSRKERRATCVRPGKTLPPTLTTLFDQSYLPHSADKSSPYVSPVAAEDEMLEMALPENIVLYLCEWDMLQKEGADFAERLSSLRKKVHCVTIAERRHAFDKSPWPFRVDPKITQYYEEACQRLMAVL